MADKNLWAEGAETMMKSWTDAQKLMWEGWADMARMPTVASGGNGKASASNPFAGAVQEWQRLTEANLKAWQGKSPLTGNVAQQMMASQGMMMQLLEHSTQAWQAMVPQLDGGDWQETLQDYSKKFQAQMMNLPTSTLEASKDSGELWALYLKEWQKLAPMWMGAVTEGTEHLRAGAPGESQVMRLVDRFWSAYDSTLGRAVNAPTMGYSREFNTKLLNGFDAWTDVRRAEATYQVITSQIWVKAFDAMMKKLIERAQQGETPTSAKDLINTWVSTADDVFVNAFGTQEYIEAQGDYLNATMAYQVKERAITEAIMEAYGLPTRSELDEAYQTIHELRRDMRALKGVKKEVAALQNSDNSELESDIASLKEELKDLRTALEDAHVALKKADKASAEGAKALERNLPLEDYGDMSVADITAKFDDLSRYELEQVRAFELLHKNRKTLMQELDRALGGE